MERPSADLAHLAAEIALGCCDQITGTVFGSSSRRWRLGNGIFRVRSELEIKRSELPLADHDTPIGGTYWTGHCGRTQRFVVLVEQIALQGVWNICGDHDVALGPQLAGREASTSLDLSPSDSRPRGHFPVACLFRRRCRFRAMSFRVSCRTSSEDRCRRTPFPVPLS